jgi:hypothetical protein
MMPALRNERHERFAREIAKGKNGADAYLAAGYALARDAASRNAYRLRSRQDIRERIDELAGKTRGRIAVEQVVEGVRTGRPTLYRPELCELARRLALLGLTETEMAEAFNIDVGTLIEWKARHKEFREAIERGGVHADAHMADSLYHRGLGYRHEAVKIFMPAGAAAPVYAPYTQHYPPDTQAMSLWLRNRQPAKWRDRQEVNHTGTLDQRLAAMTPDERAADAIALVQRIQARLAAARTFDYEADDDPGVSDAEEE